MSGAAALAKHQIRMGSLQDLQHLNEVQSRKEQDLNPCNWYQTTMVPFWCQDPQAAVSPGSLWGTAEATAADCHTRRELVCSSQLTDQLDVQGEGLPAFISQCHELEEHSLLTHLADHRAWMGVQGCPPSLPNLATCTLHGQS